MGSSPSIFFKSISLALVNKICDKSGNGIHFRITCYSHLSRSKTPNPHTLISEHMTSSCLLTRPHHALTSPSSEAGHLLLCSYHLRRRDSPWQSKSLPYPGSFWYFPLTVLLFQSLFFLFLKKKYQKRSLRSLAFLSHIPLNPQPTAI